VHLAPACLGPPHPVFTCETCGHEVCEIDDAPSACAKCGGAVTQDPDVLDTWFSSALWPFSTMGWPEETPDLKTYYPTSVLVTAHDIIFFWVARMIMMGLRFMGDVPFRDIFITPLIMAEGGGKMSKSKGNAIDPLDLVAEQGADAVRLTLASHAAQSRTVKLSPKRFEGYRNFTNKLWNAARFVLMNVEDLAPDDLAAGTDDLYLELEDRWILSLLRRTTEDAERALEDYQFDRYLGVLYDFTWKHYCDWYLEIVKPRLYASQKENYTEAAQASRRSAQVVLVTVLETLQRLFHPVAPFITEAIWQRLKLQWGIAADGAANPACRALAAPSLVVAPWPDAESTGRDRRSRRTRPRGTPGDRLPDPQHPRRDGRAARNADRRRTCRAGPERVEALRRLEPYLTGLINVGELRLTPKPPPWTSPRPPSSAT
jgi:valyl-tRNA synthetase